MGPAALGRTGDLPATPSKRLDGTGFPQQCSFFRICEDFHEGRQGPGRPATRESGETPVHGSSNCRNPRTMFGVDSHIREKLQFALGKPRFRPSDDQPQAATVNQTPPNEWQRKGWQAERPQRAGRPRGWRVARLAGRKAAVDSELVACALDAESFRPAWPADRRLSSPEAPESGPWTAQRLGKGASPTRTGGQVAPFPLLCGR